MRDSQGRNLLAFPLGTPSQGSVHAVVPVGADGHGVALSIGITVPPGTTGTYTVSVPVVLTPLP